MQYREHRVAAPLDRFVECIWSLSTSRDAGLAEPEQRILPDGCIELIVHLGERFQELSADNARDAQPGCLVAGMLTRPFRVAAVAGADTVGVRFRPGGAHPFFACPLALLTNRATALEDVWGPDAAALRNRMHAAAGDAERVRIVSDALATRLARFEPDPHVALAVHDLIRTRGRASVTAIARRAGLTPRHLQRRFASRVGVSPKTLARILRFQNTLRHRAARGAQPDGDWLRVAIDCGYTDQSHLIHDYAEFAGETPVSLRAAEGELSAYFTAPQRLAALFGDRR